MITLVTGTPGAGKTLYALRFMKGLEKDYRFIFAHGITGLKLDHEIIVCESKTCDFCQSLSDYETYKKVKDWNSYADTGAVFFIDECQHIYRNKGSMSVSEFETHRHKGIDFYLVTQHPMLINSDLRRLIGRHIHLVADFMGRKQYEWPECNQALSTAKAVRSKYKLDKSLFALYQSSSLHTKVERKVPFILYVMIGAVFVFLFSAFQVKQKFSPKLPVVEASPIAKDSSLPFSKEVPKVSSSANPNLVSPKQELPPIIGKPVIGRLGSNLLVKDDYNDTCYGKVVSQGKSYRFCKRGSEIIYKEIIYKEI